jgi:Protein of unknown function (DUF2752)
VSSHALFVRPPIALQAPRGALPLGAIFGGLAALGCAAVGLLGLDHLGFTVCFFRLATGIPCATCGATRAFGRLFRFDLWGALAMNPLVALGTLGLLVWGAADLALLPTRRALRLGIAPAWQPAVRILAVVLVLLNWAFLVFASR